MTFDLQVSDEPDSLTRTFLSPAHQRASKQVSRHGLPVQKELQ